MMAKDGKMRDTDVADTETRMPGDLQKMKRFFYFVLASSPLRLVPSHPIKDTATKSDTPGTNSARLSSTSARLLPLLFACFVCFAGLFLFFVLNLEFLNLFVHAISSVAISDFVLLYYKVDQRSGPINGQTRGFAPTEI